MPKITITLRNTSTNERRDAISDSSGNYVFVAVSTGLYQMEAEAPGFKRVVHGPVNLGVNQNARVLLKLEIGSGNQVVEVTSDAPLVDTRDVQVGSTIDSKRIQELPLDGRNVYDLMQLTPGTVNVSTSLTGVGRQQQHERQWAACPRKQFLPGRSLQ